MKSLEILENETIANIFLDTAEEFIKDITKGLEINKETKEDIQIICNIISEFGSRVADKIQKSLFPIKKDLEVLEQIKALHTERYIHQSDDGNYYPIQNIYGSVRPRIHTKLGKIEDILEKWLEENENDR